MRRGHRIVGIALCVGLGGPALASPVRGVTGAATAHLNADRADASTPRGATPAVGLMADAGVPDGAQLSLVVVPTSWLRVHAGGGSNTVSFGVRGGLTLIPLGQGPSLSVELGHFRGGDANKLVRRFVGLDDAYQALLRDFGYTFANAQLGLDYGGRNLAFFVHAGVSYVRATLDNLNVSESFSSEFTEVMVRRDPVLHVWGPSLKLGCILYLR